MAIWILNKNVLLEEPNSLGWKAIPNSKDEFRLEFQNEESFKLFLKSHNTYNIHGFFQSYLQCHILREDTKVVEIEGNFSLPLFNRIVIIICPIAWFLILFFDGNYDWVNIFIYLTAVFAIWFNIRRFKNRLYHQVSLLQG